MSTEALPVRVALAGPYAASVRDHVESRGWQVVDATTEGLVPPALTLTDAAAVDAGAEGEPVVLVVAADDDPALAADAAISCRAAVCLRWPDDRGGLHELAGRLVAAPRAGTSPAVVRVGGASGGVGTSTVALALGGLVAWCGRRALVAARGDVPSPIASTITTADLSSAGLWEAGVPARGVPGLRSVRVTGPPADASPPAAGADLVVHDVGVDDEADVLVVRRDAAGRAALERSVAGTTVLVDHGPAALPALREAAAGRRLVVVPWSVRVARAGLSRRVPAGLPGRWLRSLSPVLRGVPLR